MTYILIVILMIGGAAAAYMTFFKSEPEMPYISPASTISESAIGETLGSFTQKKDDLIDQSEQAKEEVKDSVYQTIQGNLNSLFGITESSLDISVTPTASPEAGSEIIKINFDQPNNSPVKIKKGVKYSLVFNNTPNNYCIYISDTKYPIGDDKTLIFQINEAGNYPIKANSCETNERDIGQLSVE